jgi:predicted  nucleic acid-binding Zn-ribbon protein
MVDYTRGFHDPIVRCDQCNKLTHKKYIRVNGGCAHCGNKRFRSVQGLDETEIKGLQDGTLDIGVKKYDIDPDFLALFEAVSEVVDG